MADVSDKKIKKIDDTFENHFSIKYITSLSYDVKNKYIEASESILIIAASFFIPFLLGHPQLVVGIAVNVLLIESALYLKDYKLIAPIVLPSIGAFSRAVLFGPFTKHLIFMLPFIWLGNLVQVLIVKILKIYLKKNFLISGFASAALKSAFLFTSAFLLFKIGFVPKMFLNAFGIMQFITASAAVLIIYPAFRVRKYLKEKKNKR